MLKGQGSNKASQKMQSFIYVLKDKFNLMKGQDSEGTACGEDKA